MPDDQESRIRERAYRIWEEEGSPEERDQEHWSQAEKEIGEEDAKSANTAESVAPAKKKG